MVNYQKVWADVAVTLMDRLNPDDLNTVQQAVICALGKYDISEKTENTELVVYNDDMTGYTMFFCSKGVEGLSKRTLALYKDTVDRFFRFVNKPISAITTNDIRFYLAKRRTKDKISITTMENERRNLSSFFGWLFDEKYISDNVCKPIKKIKTAKIKKKAFTDVEVQKIKDACSIKLNPHKEERAKRNIALIEFLLCTGCRVGEVAGLKKENIDLEHSCATVLGKGNKERIVYLSEICKMRINDYWKYTENKEFAFSSLANYQKSNNHLWEISGIEIEIRRIGKLAGVEKCHPHRFRRTCATTALKKGMNIIDVQKMLGHENLDTTRIYLDLDNTELEYAHTKIFG